MGLHGPRSGIAAGAAADAGTRVRCRVIRRGVRILAEPFAEAAGAGVVAGVAPCLHPSHILRYHEWQRAHGTARGHRRGGRCAAARSQHRCRPSGIPSRAEGTRLFHGGTHRRVQPGRAPLERPASAPVAAAGSGRLPRLGSGEPRDGAVRRWSYRGAGRVRKAGGIYGNMDLRWRDLARVAHRGDAAAPNEFASRYR